MTTIDSKSQHLPAGVGYIGAALRESSDIISPEALKFIARLEREFGERRRNLIKKRQEKQRQITTGRMPTMLPETEHVRTAYWRVAPIPNKLLDRRVEFVGPPNIETIDQVLNSGVNIYVADFEDTNVPSWRNIVQGHENLYDWVRGTFSRLGGDPHPNLIVCPRGLHAEEKHVTIDGRPVSASLFDFGLFFFHNARELHQQDQGPYFYIPKIENHFEAGLWNDVFLMAQDELELPHGTIKATVIIESILAALEMHEILHTLREHCVGLNCGRWNYIFSIIKKFRHHQEYMLPDRSRLSTMNHFLRSFSLLLLQTCHKRGAHAISGVTMHNNTAGEDGTLQGEAAFKIRSETELDVEDGFDGVWVIHPSAAQIAKRVFDAAMPGPNQLQKKRDDVDVTADDLLTIQSAEVTDTEISSKVDIALSYFASWLGGNAILRRKDFTELVPTAEIARSQLWQWINLPSMRRPTDFRANVELYRRISDEQTKRLLSFDTQEGLTRFYPTAKSILDSIVLDKNFAEFFTSSADVYLE